MGQGWDRAQAVLQAALVGDALGAPFNGLKSGHIQQLIGNRAEGFLKNPKIQPGRPERNVLPGLHCSQGQRLLASLAALAPDSAGREPAARVGALLTDLAGDAEEAHGRLGALRQPGRPLRRAAIRWRTDYPWAEDDYFATTEESEGIGAALVGLVPACAESPDSAALAVSLARLTHFKSLPVIAAVAVARLIELLRESGGGKKIDAQGIVRALLESVKVAEEAYDKAHARTWRELGWGRTSTHLSEALGALPSLLREGDDLLAERTLVNTAAQVSSRFPVTHPQHGYVLTSLPWAFYRALGPLPGGIAVEDVLNRGGETSAVAALVAALSVARHGTATLPDEWWAGTLAIGEVPALFGAADETPFASWADRERGWSGREDRELHEPMRESLRVDAELEAERERRKPKKTGLPAQEDAAFAPPPHLWLKPGEEENPINKKIMKEQRARRRIDWKEDRRDKNRGGDEPPEE